MKARSPAQHAEPEANRQAAPSGGALGEQQLVGNAALAQRLGPVQLHGSGGGQSAQGRQERALQGVQGGGGRMPFQGQLEEAFGGHDLSGVQVHQDEPARAALGELGADGFMMGNQAAFDGPPSLWLAAHEGAHYVMQQAGLGPTGPAGQAGDAFEEHADRVADRVVAGKPMEGLLPSPDAMRGGSAAPSVQAYTTQSVGDVSENGKMVLAGRQELYAEASLVSGANAQLAKAGKDGSFIELKAGSGSLSHGGKTLSQVSPEWIQGRDDSYHKGAHDSNKAGGKDSEGNTGGDLALWTDCGRSSSAVTGSKTGSDRSVIYNKDGAEKSGGRVKDSTMTYKNALPNELANGIYLDLIPGFIARADNQAFLKEGVHFRMVDSKTANTAKGAGAGLLGGAAIGAGIGSFFGGVGAVPGAVVGGLIGGLVGGITGGVVGNKLPAEKVKEYIAPKTATEAKTMYWELGSAGRDRFDQEAGINHYANPEVGEAYSMATEADMPGFKRMGPRTWNYHWAGVIMKDGGDNVTLENFAVYDPSGTGKVNGVPTGDYIDRDWNFDMYGTKDKSQTFHKDHLDSNTHGSHATSIAVRTDK